MIEWEHEGETDKREILSVYIIQLSPEDNEHDKQEV